jgi:dynein assembly factor 1
LKDYSQLSSEIQSKLKILKALVDNEKEVNELISKSETEKANEEFIKNEEKKKEENKKENEESKNQDNEIASGQNELSNIIDDDGIIKDSKTGEIYHYARYNRFTGKDIPEEEQQMMSRRYLDKILCSDFKQYYRTHELNEILYLHYKSFKRIQNLETFTNLKVLYLEGNAISKIEGLESLVNLTSLYLHENCIDKIEGLDTLSHLANLNLSDNLIKKVENLKGLKSLTNLLIKRNRIGIKGLEDLYGLLDLGKDFAVLDISDNLIDDPKIVDEILTKFIDLRVIYLKGNDVVRKIPNYRKTLISRIDTLKYIDDKPIFEDERRFALAFAKGGYEEEKKERARYREEVRLKEEKRIRDFCKMMNKYKEGDLDFEEKKETEEEREKKKLELLNKIKNKNKDIFSGTDIEQMPEITNKNKIESNIKENEKEDKKEEKEDENPPELEIVKKEDNKNEEKVEVKQPEPEEEKNKEIKNETKEDNKENENNKENIQTKEDNNDKGVKIAIKEADLDELD